MHAICGLIVGVVGMVAWCLGAVVGVTTETPTESVSAKQQAVCLAGCVLPIVASAVIIVCLTLYLVR